jgi:hydrogenase maturation protease
MQTTLILGYGNADRQDDGAAWHVLCAVAQRLGYPAPADLEAEWPPLGDNVDLLFVLQLTPELAETVAQYPRVCFVDAHTGSVPDDLHWQPLGARLQPSPLTHHMTPESLLAFAQALYQATPEAVLVSIRGYEFGFQQGLSAQTAGLVAAAGGRIAQWAQAA